MAAFGGPSLIGFVGVFRTRRGFVKSYFVILLGVRFAFEVEPAVVVDAIDYAWSFSWRRR